MGPRASGSPRGVGPAVRSFETSPADASHRHRGCTPEKSCGTIGRNAGFTTQEIFHRSLVATAPSPLPCPCRAVAVSRAMREGFANFCTTSRECAGARRSLSPLRRVDPPPSVFPRFASPPLASLGSTLLSVASFLLTFSWRTGRPTCTSSRLWFGTTPSRWFSRRRRPWCTERSPGPRRRR